MIAILEKVRLKKENYLTLMQHVKVFADDRSTQKKAYKILAKVVERFELTGLDEITEIKQTIIPLMKGQASKDRVVLINSFINAVSEITKNAQGVANLAQTIELLRPFVVELISAIRNSNQKIRTAAQDAFLAMARILSSYQALPQLF